MAKNFLISPSILAADFANLEKEVKSVAKAGADYIHVDVMDGHFVDNLTIGIPVVASLKKISPLPLDVHLMIEKPEKYIEDFVRAGSDWLTIHVEATEKPDEVLRRIRELGAKPGITLRPRTSIEKVLPYLPLADLVLVMTVEPGFGGQSFMHDQAAKMTRLKDEIGRLKLKTKIEVDGGVNEKTKDFCQDADILVAGSAIFGKPDYAKAIQALKA